MPASIQKIVDKKNPSRAKYRVQFELGKDESGKRKRESKQVSTLKEAEQMKKEFERQEKLNELPSLQTISLQRLLDKWKTNYMQDLADTTQYGYANIINNHLVPFLGSKQVKQIQISDVENYYSHLRDIKKLEANTIHRHHALLKMVLDYGIRLQYITNNTADLAHLPKIKHKEAKFYSAEQLKKVLVLVKDTNLELAIVLAGMLGLRRGEIAGLRWSDVDFINRELHILNVRTSAGSLKLDKEPKTESSKRKLYLIDYVYEVLLKHKEKQLIQKEKLGSFYNDNDYVLVKDDGAPPRVNGVSDQFLLFLKTHSLPHIRLHDLRHTFASILHDNGISLKDISTALGHTDIGITSKIYTHIMDKTHKKAVSAMNDIMTN